MRHASEFAELCHRTPYGRDPQGVKTAAGLIAAKQAELGLAKPIWSTEVNFKNGTCDTSEQTLASWHDTVWREMRWERSFVYALIDSQTSCGFGLVQNPGNPSGGLKPKAFLYPAVAAIVAGKPIDFARESEDIVLAAYSNAQYQTAPIGPTDYLVLWGRGFGAGASVQRSGTLDILTPDFAGDTQINLRAGALGGSRYVRVIRDAPNGAGGIDRHVSAWLPIEVRVDDMTLAAVRGFPGYTAQVPRAGYAILFGANFGPAGTPRIETASGRIVVPEANTDGQINVPFRALGETRFRVIREARSAEGTRELHASPFVEIVTDPPTD